jgi:hypothetical protein
MLVAFGLIANRKATPAKLKKSGAKPECSEPLEAIQLGRVHAREVGALVRHSAGLRGSSYARRQIPKQR